MGDDVMVTSFKFTPYKCTYFKFSEPIKFIFVTNFEQHNVHLMIKIQVEGQRSQKMNECSYLANYHTQRHHTWYQGTMQ